MPQTKNKPCSVHNTGITSSYGRDGLIEGLDAYIKRVEGETIYVNKQSIINYAYGFIFFRQSRATNRHANLLLAKQLREELSSSNDSISSIFADVITKRQQIAKENKIPHFKNHDHGINSNELSAVIEQARLCAKVSAQVERQIFIQETLQKAQNIMKQTCY